MQVETQIGRYYVTYMVFPAFPKADEPGRVNLYATRIDTGKVFDGEVEFSVGDDRWFESETKFLGVQRIDDGVYRQGFLFKEDGDYIVRASFTAQGEPYTIDLPLQVGEPSRIGVLGALAFLIFGVLLVINLYNRHRLSYLKIRSERAKQ